MKMNTSKNVMKCVGATLAICSAVTMMNSVKSSSSAKKTIKKTAGKVVDMIDTINTFM
jgi:hypothetical protein